VKECKEREREASVHPWIFYLLNFAQKININCWEIKKKKEREWQQYQSLKSLKNIKNLSH
jgi:hypothetical protein